MLILVCHVAARFTLLWQMSLWVSIYFTHDSGNYRVFTVSEMCCVTIVVLLCRAKPPTRTSVNPLLPPTTPMYPRQ